MADSVIVIPGDSAGPGTETPSSEFLAGVATATATQAATEAHEAVAAAERAADNAAASAAVVFATADDIAELRADVDDMGDRMLEALGQIAGLAIEAATDTDPVDDQAPEVVVNTGSGDVTTGEGDKPADDDQADKPAPKTKKGFGSNWWFGPAR